MTASDDDGASGFSEIVDVTPVHREPSEAMQIALMQVAATLTPIVDRRLAAASGSTQTPSDVDVARAAAAAIRVYRIVLATLRDGEPAHAGLPSADTGSGNG